jgi:hypothetical protein
LSSSNGSRGTATCAQHRKVADRDENDRPQYPSIDSVEFAFYAGSVAVVEAGEIPARTRHCNRLCSRESDLTAASD